MIGKAAPTTLLLFGMWFLNFFCFFALTLNQHFRTSLRSERLLAIATKFIKIHREFPKDNQIIFPKCDHYLKQSIN